MSTILPILTGFTGGFSASMGILQTKAEEKAFVRGGHKSSVAMSQFTHAIWFNSVLTQVLTATNRTFSYSGYLLAGSAIASNVALATLEKNQKGSLLHRSVKLIHENNANIILVATVISNIALLHLGATSYVVGSLTLLSITCLKKYMPLKIYKAFTWIPLLGAILNDNWLLRIMTLLNLADKIKNIFFKAEKIPSVAIQNTSSLTYSQFDTLMKSSPRLTVNREHVHVTPIPQSTQRDYTSLLTLFDTIDWNNPVHSQSLRKSLSKNSRWEDFQEKNKDKDHTDLAVMIQFARAQLHTLIVSVTNECIETGKPLDYSVLKNYLGLITDMIPKADANTQKVVLLDLALSGGDYCGSGVYHTLENGVTHLFSTGASASRLPLKQRFFMLLQQERLKIVQAYHFVLGEINPVYCLLFGGKDAVHAMNLTASLFANDFGLPDQGAADEHNLSMTDKKFMQWMMQLNPEKLWRNSKQHGKQLHGYTVNRIIDGIATNQDNPLIPHADFYEWATNWINLSSTGATEEEKAAFLKDLETAFVFEDTHTQKFHDRFIAAMLVDMGVLKVEP